MSQTIIRAARRHRFVIIDQHAVEDARLSWAARGLLGYLLSRPDDWKVLVNDLRKRGDLGRDGIYRLLRELRETGYMRFVRKRDRHGRIRGGTYFVQEIAASLHPDLPDMAEPDTAEPYPVNPEALPTTELNLRRTTTTTPTTTKERGSRYENENSIVEFVAWVPHELKDAALETVAGLSPVDQQIVIDEWAGYIGVGLIETSPLDDLHDLVSQYVEGHCWIHLAEDIKEIRSKPPPDFGYICPIEVCEVSGD